MSARIEQVVTSGVFSLDGEDFEVENNVWIVGDDDEVVIIDAAHDAEEILAAVGDREVLAVICTHGHNDHINAAVDIGDDREAGIALHPADAAFWHEVYADDEPDIDLEDGGVFEVAGTRLEIIHTPGHSPGGVSVYAPDLGVVFSGDTLFKGGPGATGRRGSDFATILASIGERLLDLPPTTRVLPGHGEETTVGAEARDFDTWVTRGY